MGTNSGRRVRCDRTPAWSALQTLFASGRAEFDLRQAFASDPGRFDAFSHKSDSAKQQPHEAPSIKPSANAGPGKEN